MLAREPVVSSRWSCWSSKYLRQRIVHANTHTQQRKQSAFRSFAHIRTCLRSAYTRISVMETSRRLLARPAKRTHSRRLLRMCFGPLGRGGCIAARSVIQHPQRPIKTYAHTHTHAHRQHAHSAAPNRMRYLNNVNFCTHMFGERCWWWWPVG